MSPKNKLSKVRLNNVHWELYRSTLIPAEPPDRPIFLKKEECHELFHLTNAWLIRWPSCWNKKEVSSFWYIIKENYNGFGEFSRNTRSKIRRGLKRNVVRRIGREELKIQGYPVYEGAFTRYDTSRKLARDEFLRRIEGLNPDQYEFWGVYQGTALVAYAEIRHIKDVINTSVMKFHPSGLKDYSSYALFYTLIEHYLGKRKIRYITNGARSLSHDTNIQGFLIEKFNFRKAYCKLNVCYTGFLGNLVRVAYPLRSLIGMLPIWPFDNLHALLMQEYIRRNS